MAEYHVGCGLFGIYAGTLKKSKESREWKNKTECTNEALCACAQYLFDNKKKFRFEQKGKVYVMRIEELKDGEG